MVVFPACLEGAYDLVLRRQRQCHIRAGASDGDISSQSEERYKGAGWSQAKLARASPKTEGNRGEKGFIASVDI